MQTIKAAGRRNTATDPELRRAVADIIEAVQAKGDDALLAFSLKYDQSDRRQFRLSEAEIAAAYAEVPAAEVEDLRQAAANITAFATAQRGTIADLPAFQPQPGVVLGHRVLPVEACCCYVPGGGYPLYSSALMLAIPAKVAGVKRVAAASPAQRGTGKIYPKTVVAMDIAGVDEIYALGGAQAVAAFAYGTEQVAPVDVITGPGNRYVTEAKRQCYGQVGIDFIAGPSEVLVLADDTADPQILAADLLAQSEHDLVAQGVLVTTSAALAHSTIEAVEKLLETLPTAGIAARSWADFGEVILAGSLEEAVDIANERAPEHLELQLADNEAVAEKLFNYGSLFIGAFTAEVFGDYASGTNHTLPTMRAARYTGGVSVGSYLKTVTHQRMTRAAMADMAPLVARLAEGEGLAAHALAARLRLDRFDK